MKNSRICPKCNGRHLLQLTEVADRDGPRTSLSARTIEGENEPNCYAPAPNVPWRIARMVNPQHSDASPATAAIGLVEAYICCNCSYTEFYTRDVKAIPIDGKLVREIKPAEDEGPYR